ncbi:hypothetical protein [Bradyrhizobium sp. Ash2021]|uniref:hypothetical protein n=1 Tax=Bradyrhizobium sp. Ash2021 TaxID=2954771 RepID=UPI002814E42D|nr:hypothetical protein [Bradyrhizobium sp. Ash2021]WMT75787.1 hypothetical protein NL528_05075 [Bradyrhizobium sp. Ash2021]
MAIDLGCRGAVVGLSLLIAGVLLRDRGHSTAARLSAALVVSAAASAICSAPVAPKGEDRRARNAAGDGRLIGTRFRGPDKLACAEVAADVLNWLDEYIHKALSLGVVRKVRFTKMDLFNLNAYSID